MKETTPTNRYLTKKQIAQYCNVSTRTINNWMKRKIIPFINIGGVVRFEIEKVNKALSKYENGGFSMF